MTNLDKPAGGNVLVGWLVADDGKTAVNIGSAAGGAPATLSYKTSDGANILAKYSGFMMTSESSATATTMGTTVLYGGMINTGALPHVRHLLVAWDPNPDKKGIAVGLRQQIDIAILAAQEAADANRNGNGDAARIALEKLINTIEGSKGPNYGDPNKDGKTENPGDGFGVFNYADDASKHAGFASAAAPQDQTIVTNAQAVQAAALAAKNAATAARDNALLAYAQTDPAICALYEANALADLQTAAAQADAVYMGSQDMGTIVVLPGQPKAPSAGDINYGPIALAALLAGMVLFVGGGYLWKRSRSHA
jgi:hypothetical protein